jgi:uncharacterized membrane protein YphA (DoxX/SURF4 family)
LKAERTAAHRSPTLLRIALGIVYLHFGILKFFPDLSPAEMLASQTIIRLSWSWLDARTAMTVLAVGECAIGLAFLFDIAPRWLPFVFFGHMLGTCSPLFILPELTFKIAPFAPTLEGQYILKNMVFVAAAWTVLVQRGAFGLDRLRVPIALSKRRAAPPRLDDVVVLLPGDSHGPRADELGKGATLQ